MVEAIRQITGIYDRDITAGDVKGITKIEYTDVTGHSTNIWKGSLEPLKYFTGLVELNIEGRESTLDDNLEPLRNLVNLQL